MPVLHSSVAVFAALFARGLRGRDRSRRHRGRGPIPLRKRRGGSGAAETDGPWILERIGHQRAEEGAYVWRSLWESGAVVTNGTDVSVEDISPIESFYASVTRHMQNCERFCPEQSMTRKQALRSYTFDNAFAAFEEELKGSLTPGKLADIVVLDRDILRVPEAEIREARVVYTNVGGEVRFGGGGHE